MRTGPCTIIFFIALGAGIGPANAQPVVNETFEGYGNGILLQNPGFTPWAYYAHNDVNHKGVLLHRGDPLPSFNFPVPNVDPDSWSGVPNDHYVKLFANPGNGNFAGTNGTAGDPGEYHRGIYRPLPQPVQPGTYTVRLRTHANYPSPTGGQMWVRTRVVFAALVPNAVTMRDVYANDPGSIPGAESIVLESIVVANPGLPCDWSNLIGRICLTGSHAAVYVDVEFREFANDATTLRYRLDEIVIEPVPAGADCSSTRAFQALDPEEGPSTGTAIRIWPTPARDMVFMETGSPHDGNGVVRIIDAMGRIMHEGRVSGPLAEVDVAALPPGQYTVQFLSASAARTGRFTKE